MNVPQMEKLTAAQVRELPEGTPVYLYGMDRHGDVTILPCKVVQSGRRKMIAYRDAQGMMETRPIRELDGERHYYGKNRIW